MEPQPPTGVKLEHLLIIICKLWHVCRKGITLLTSLPFWVHLISSSETSIDKGVVRCKGVIFWSTIRVIRNESSLTQAVEKLLSTFTLNILCIEVSSKIIECLWLSVTLLRFNSRRSHVIHRLLKSLTDVLFRGDNTVLSKNHKCHDSSFALNRTRDIFLVSVVIVDRDFLN